jgi:hypothetical protein
MGQIRLNQHAFGATGFDSAGLGVLAYVMHPLPDAGVYRGTVVFGRGVAAAFLVHVEEAASATQADLDLWELAGPQTRSGQLGEHEFHVKPGGHAVFYVSQGPAGYRVSLSALNPQPLPPKKEPWDSGKLEKGDLFVVTPLRPGTYVAKAKGASGEGKVTIAALKPEPGRSFRAGAPHEIAVDAKGFHPATVASKPTEGLVFKIEAAPQVTLSLTEPGETKQSKPRWNNPRPPAPTPGPTTGKRTRAAAPKRAR